MDHPGPSLTRMPSEVRRRGKIHWRVYTCCGKTYTDKKLAKEHLRRQHDGKTSKTDVTARDIVRLAFPHWYDSKGEMTL
jgi:hypothetical protein